MRFGQSGLGAAGDECSGFSDDASTLQLQLCLTNAGVNLSDFCQNWPDNWTCLNRAAVACHQMSPDGSGLDDNGNYCKVSDPHSYSASVATQCTAQADLDTYDLDQLVQQLASGWNPTGFYTSTIIIELVGKWNERSTASRVAVASAQSAASKSGDTSLLKDRLDSLDTFDSQAQKYLQAAQDAGTDGIVQADKLKDWATRGLTAASAALHAAEVVTCQHNQDWGPLQALGQFLWTVGGITKEVLDAAYQAGKKVVKASEWLLGALGWIVTHPWTVFGGLALVVAGAFALKHSDSIKNTFSKFRSSSHKPALSGYHRSHKRS